MVPALFRGEGGGAPSFMGQRFRGRKKKVDVIVVSALTREHLLWS